MRRLSQSPAPACTTCTYRHGRQQLGQRRLEGRQRGPIDVSDDTKALLFEFDNAVPDPMITPEKSDNSDPFITIDYASEGNEYPANDGKKDVDSYGAVTIVSATLKSPDMDAMDIAGSLATTDNVKFLYKASDLAKGDHKVKVKAKDAAGNEAEFEGYGQDRRASAVQARAQARLEPRVPARQPDQQQPQRGHTRRPPGQHHTQL